MNARDAGSVRLAALLLLALSGVRWGFAASSDRGPATGGDALSGLVAGTGAAVQKADRAARPLDAGERIDPNRADVTELDRLPGVGPATALAIVEARDAGAVFRAPADLQQVRGLGPRTVEKLTPHLDLEAPPPRRSGGRPSTTRRGPVGRSTSTPATIDVNRATSAELQGLPGVGPVLADRIVAERRRRPFVHLDDLTRIPGVGPATVERLRGRAGVGPGR